MNTCELAIRWTDSSREAILLGLHYLPDAALSWSPSAASKSPLRIIAHVAATNDLINQLLGNPTAPAPEFERFNELTAEYETVVTTRAEAERVINETCAMLVETFKDSTEEQMAGDINTPFGPKPYQSWALIPSTHMDYHNGQLNYIQSILGDGTFHFDDSAPVVEPVFPV